MRGLSKKQRDSPLGTCNRTPPTSTPPPNRTPHRSKRKDESNSEHKFRFSLIITHRNTMATSSAQDIDAVGANLASMTIDTHRIRIRESYRRRSNIPRPLSVHLACNCNIDFMDPDAMQIVPHCLGPMDKQCSYCHAYGFESEMKKGKKDIKHMGKLCCSQGKINLPHRSYYPIKLYKYFTDDTLEAKHFRQLIRYFN